MDKKTMIGAGIILVVVIGIVMSVGDSNKFQAGGNIDYDKTTNIKTDVELNQNKTENNADNKAENTNEINIK